MKPLKLPETLYWIGAPRRDAFPIETGLFKTVFELNRQPDEALIHMSANTRFTLHQRERLVYVVSPEQAKTPAFTTLLSGFLV